MSGRPGGRAAALRDGSYHVARATVRGAWLDAGPFASDAAPPLRFELTLLDPGAAPRRPLRYGANAAAGMRLERRLRTTIRQSLSLDGAPTRFTASTPHREMLDSWLPVAGELVVDARRRRAPDAHGVFSGQSSERVNEALELLDDVLNA